MQSPTGNNNWQVTEDEEVKKIQTAINTLLRASQATNEPSERLSDSPSVASHSKGNGVDEHQLHSNMKFAWDIAAKLHAKNFIRMVSRKPPILHTVYRLLNKLQMGDWGYRVNIAEMQRMYLRALQVSLVDKAVKMQVQGDELGSETIVKEGRLLAGLLRDYCKWFPDAACLCLFRFFLCYQFHGSYLVQRCIQMMF